MATRLFAAQMLSCLYYAHSQQGTSTSVPTAVGRVQIYMALYIWYIWCVFSSPPWHPQVTTLSNGVTLSFWLSTRSGPIKVRFRICCFSRPVLLHPQSTRLVEAFFPNGPHHLWVDSVWGPSYFRTRFRGYARPAKCAMISAGPSRFSISRYPFQTNGMLL